MPRTVNAATKTALEGDSLQLAHLVQFDFSSTLRFTDNYRRVLWGSLEYLPAGHLLSFGSSQETQDLRVGSVNITLSGVEQSYVSIFLNQQYINRRARIWLAFLDASNDIIGDPIPTFDGEVVGYSIQDSDESSIISVDVASHWADFERKNARYTNNNSQQFYFPNDTGMRFSAESIKDIKWGKA